MIANNNMKLSFSINTILHETKDNQNEVLELSDQRFEKKKVLISKIDEDQTDTPNSKSVRVKELEFEDNRDETFSQSTESTAELKNNKSEENYDNYLDDENDEEYEIDAEKIDEKRENANNLGNKHSMFK